MAPRRRVRGAARAHLTAHAHSAPCRQYTVPRADTCHLLMPPHAHILSSHLGLHSPRHARVWWWWWWMVRTYVYTGEALGSAATTAGSSAEGALKAKGVSLQLPPIQVDAGAAGGAVEQLSKAAAEGGKAAAPVLEQAGKQAVPVAAKALRGLLGALDTALDDALKD